jgi:hypothetical protein
MHRDRRTEQLFACPAGETKSEGGFKPGKVSAASLLDVQEATDKSGKPYYKFEILTRTGNPCDLFFAKETNLGAGAFLTWSDQRTPASYPAANIARRSVLYEILLQEVRSFGDQFCCVVMRVVCERPFVC